MRIRLRTQRDMWVFCATVTLVAMVASELVLCLMFLTFGDEAFSRNYAFLLAAVVPVIVALPICYLTARMALQLSRAHARLQHLAHTDELTGLINRRSFFSHAGEVLRAAASEQSSLSLLVIDADYFKQLNDTYGHAVGDAALQFITEKLLGCVRKTDLVCRLGGEEFAMLLPGLAAPEALRLADRLLKTISSQPMICDSKIVEMSVSCGIADTSLGYDMALLFKAADHALYAAKDAGRNRTIVYSGVATTSARSDALPAGA